MEYNKKSVAVLLTLMLAFLIVGFDAVPGLAGSLKSKPTVGKSQPVKMSSTNKVSQRSIKYNLVKETYSKNKITIRYPQITDFGDSAKQKKLNAILKSDALKRLNNYKEWASAVDKPFEKAIEASIDYTVKWKGNNLLSVAYSGYSCLNGDRSERDYNTVNLDLNTGKLAFPE